MKFKYLFNKIRGFWFRKYYVTLDGRANSVTISKALYEHMMRYERTTTEILVFKSGDTKLYSFAMREDFVSLHKIQTYFSTLQYNERYEKIGFRTDHPSVTAILDDYGLPCDKMVRLSVIPRKTNTEVTFYEIQRPI